MTAPSVMKPSTHLPLFIALFFTHTKALADATEFYTQKGSDPSFQEVMKSGDLPRGKNSRQGFKGSTVKVNHDLLANGPNSRRPLLKEIRIHSLGSSGINRPDFSNWSRWYQEDKNTQIFRLFKGEENVRNSRALAARIEAFTNFTWVKGDWQEWVGTYTIIKPQRCAIFQAKNTKNDWAVIINMNDDGDVRINHRGGENKLVARDMVGKPFHIRVRDNGLNYEVYFNGKKEGEGSWKRPQGHNSFRWGMYLGAKEVRHDAMILVTGAALNPRKVDYDSEQSNEPEPEAEAEPGILLPRRDWTNKEGKTIAAEALLDLESMTLKLRVNDNWVPLPFSTLSDADHREILKVLETMKP